MAGLRAFLRSYSTPHSVRGWRGAPFLALVAAIVIALPEARALLTAGVLGGSVLGVLLILVRHQSGPRRPDRGTPIVLFPRPVSEVRNLGNFFLGNTFSRACATSGTP